MSWAELPRFVRSSPERTWSHARLTALNIEFERRSPEEMMSWAVETFGSSLVMATGFGPSGIVLMHMASRMDVRPEIFFLDTELLFPETYALREKLQHQLGIEIRAVEPSMSVAEQSVREGENLWQRNPDRCCFLRKVLPLRRFLADRQAWITGIRRDQSLTRRSTRLIEWDFTNHAVKLNPLALWTEEEVWTYIHIHDLPFNPLHERGYPSIGCMPCTHPVDVPDDLRSGRWSGLAKTECGIHLPANTV